MTSLDDAELTTLAIIPIITGTISVIASSYVLQDIIRDPKKRMRTYCRLVFGMAAIDFLTSLMYAFSTLPMEKGVAVYGVFAVGNHSTCTTQAFFYSNGNRVAHLSLLFGMVLHFNSEIPMAGTQI
mmetsp:Transcript_3104/g.7296  ORF Transcript_3104/g.7296 Transcript_3104/m.7296 type:complete len:126 (+) Transcript_3104:209-586(+)